jgi:multiple sugar transport system substrate-binding protein
MAQPIPKKSDTKKIAAAIAIVIIVIAAIAGGYWYFARPPREEQVTIRVIIEVTPIADELQKLVPKFEEETGIKVIWEAYSYDAVIEKEMTDFIAETGIYDVVVSAAPRFYGMVKNGYLLPLDQYINDPAITPPDYDWDDLIPGIMNRGKIDGVTYGFPGLNYINYLSYRTDLLDDPANKAAFKAKYNYEYGVPPRNLQEFKDLVEFFNNPPTIYGTVICAKRGFAAFADYFVLLAAHGGQIIDAEGKPQMNSEAAIEAMRDFVWLVQHAPPGAVEFEWDASAEAMGGGEVALSVQWADHGVYFETDPNSKVAGKIGYDTFPGVETGKRVALWDGSYLAISSFSKHPSESYEFLKWVLSKETQLEWARLGSTPMRYSVFQDPELRAEWPFYKALEDSLAEGVVFTHPQLSETSEIEDIIALYLSKATIGELTVEQACAEAQGEIERLLGTSAT